MNVHMSVYIVRTFCVKSDVKNICDICIRDTILNSVESFDFEKFSVSNFIFPRFNKLIQPSNISQIYLHKGGGANILHGTVRGTSTYRTFYRVGRVQVPYVPGTVHTWQISLGACGASVELEICDTRMDYICDHYQDCMINNGIV